MQQWSLLRGDDCECLISDTAKIRFWRGDIDFESAATVQNDELKGSFDSLS